MEIYEKTMPGQKTKAGYLWLLRLISFVLTIFICFAAFAFFKEAPFGNHTLALSDAYLQYMDFMAFFKDVLSRNQSLAYTMTKGLGGSAIGIFSYYLASPTELLQLFFSKDQIPLSYNLAAVLKMGMASLTMTWFLQERFHKRISIIPLLGLSIGYGLMHYNLYQTWSAMWLDGVYMLPLMMLGVYRAVHFGAIGMLSVSTALSILFNWYTGGINCLFSGFWFLAEEIMLHFQRGRTKKEFLHSAARYVFGMVTGILISSILFLPTIWQLREGIGGSFDWNRISLGFQGDILASLGAYYMGINSAVIPNLNYMSLFCGSLAVSGALALFTVKELKRKYKILAFLMIIFAFFMFHWKILFWIFSLMKEPMGFMPRYSYLGCFILIFLSGSYFSSWGKWKFGRKALLICLLFPLFQILIEQVRPAQYPELFKFSVLFLILIPIVLYEISRSDKDPAKRKLMTGVLACLLAWEMGQSVCVFLSTRGGSSLYAYESYDNQQRNQIQGLKDYDKGIYRINQVTNKGDIKKESSETEKFEGISFNEAMNFNYWGMQEYNSLMKMSQFHILSNMGYYGITGRYNVFHTPILPTDSFFGVKYVLSPNPVEGLVPVPVLGVANGKEVYENPYVLPLAFIYHENHLAIPMETNNPFTYTNAVYSKLMGHTVSIYSPVAFTENSENSHEIYKINNGLSPLYAYLVWNGSHTYISINGEHDHVLRDSGMFYIPATGSQTRAIDVDLSDDIRMKQALFYETDLSALKEISREINQSAAENITIKDGEISGTVEGREGDILFLSVPYENGWTVMRNGKEITPDIFAGCLMNIPLVEGENHIQMTYHIPGLTAGAILTFIGMVLLGENQYKRGKLGKYSILRLQPSETCNNNKNKVN